MILVYVIGIGRYGYNPLLLDHEMDIYQDMLVGK
jgi:hypothetical protein